MQRVGQWIFILGVIVAIVGGLLFPQSGELAIILVIAGVVVGFLNITEQETTPFLVASIALIAAGIAGFAPLNALVAGLGAKVSDLIREISIFVAPAAVIVALKSVYVLASKK